MKKKKHNKCTKAKRKKNRKEDAEVLAEAVWADELTGDTEVDRWGEPSPREDTSQCQTLNLKLSDTEVAYK